MSFFKDKVGCENWDGESETFLQKDKIRPICHELRKVSLYRENINAWHIFNMLERRGRDATPTGTLSFLRFEAIIAGCQLFAVDEMDFEKVILFDDCIHSERLKSKD